MTDQQNNHPERELFFTFFIHEAENLHNRVDWFLIFHAILLEAFVAAHSLVHHITVGVLGCLVSYVWLVAGIRQLWNLRHMAESISDENIMGRESANLFKRLFDTRRLNQPGWMKWASATPAFSAVLPLALLMAWVIVTATATEGGIGFKVLIGVLIILFLFGCSLLWSSIQDRPEVSSKAVEHLHHRSDDL